MKNFISFLLLASGCYGISFPKPEIPLARIRRSTTCDIHTMDERNNEFKVCIDRTTDDFGNAVENYDGRSHFFERKICNTMEGIMNCFVKILPCFPEDVLEELMTNQLENVKGIMAIADDFDEDKCPYYAWFKGGYKTEPNGISSGSNIVSSLWIAIFFGVITSKLM